MLEGIGSNLHGERRKDHDPPFGCLCSVVTPTVSRTSFFLQTAHLHFSSMLAAAAPHITETGPLKHAARAINWLHALAAEFFAKGTTH